jgi:hypothetical protein
MVHERAKVNGKSPLVVGIRLFGPTNRTNRLNLHIPISHARATAGGDGSHLHWPKKRFLLIRYRNASGEDNNGFIATVCKNIRLVAEAALAWSDTVDVDDHRPCHCWTNLEVQGESKHTWGS